jgi:hypothetical protein
MEGSWPHLDLRGRGAGRVAEELEIVEVLVLGLKDAERRDVESRS